MQSALTWFMTGPAPQERSGDAIERRSGYVALADVLTIVNEQGDRFTDALNDLKTTFREESQTTRHLVDTYRSETNRRLDALEAWRNQEEIAEAVRNGRLAIFLLAFRWVTEHWQVIWAVVALVLGLAWTLTGNQPVGVGPIDSKP